MKQNDFKQMHDNTFKILMIFMKNVTKWINN